MEKEDFITGEISEEGRLQKIYTLTEKSEEEYSRKKELLKDRFFEAFEAFKTVAADIYGTEDEQKPMIVKLTHNFTCSTIISTDINNLRRNNQWIFFYQDL